MGTNNDDAGLGGSEGNTVQPWFQLFDAFLTFLEVEKEKVEGALGEEALVSGIVFFLPAKIPDTEIENLSTQPWLELPLAYIYPYS